MPQGTVKDPDGRQSQEYDFGYIQREKGGPPWSSKDPSPKAIPFKNGTVGNRDFSLGQSIQYTPKKAVVFWANDPQIKGLTPLGTIGIADVKEKDPK